MRFYNQFEQNYLNNFIKQHCEITEAYFKLLLSSLTFVEGIEKEVTKNSYLFLYAVVELFKAGVSLFKSIYGLLSFSFKGAKSAAIDAGCYFASGTVKFGFYLISICLDLVQFLTKAITTYFYTLKFFSILTFG